MFPVYHLDGQPYLDGGCADAIPWKRAFDQGCDRVVVLLTRERSYRKDTGSMPSARSCSTQETEHGAQQVCSRVFMIFSPFCRT